MKKKQFTIDVELLTLVSFLIRGGGGQSIYCSQPWHFLSEVCEELPKSSWTDHIVTTAFDNIPHSMIDALQSYCYKKCSLTEETKCFLAQRGFIHRDGYAIVVPKAVRKYVKIHFAWMYRK